MGIRKEIEKRIEKKQLEMQELEQETAIRLRECSAYIQALQESLRLIPKEAADEPVLVLRPGSAIARAKAEIEKEGRPLHISELLKALGKPIDHASRAALSGSLAAYVRKGEIFTRPAPNTFGLVEFDSSEPEQKQEDEPPETFGVDNGNGGEIDPF